MLNYLKKRFDRLRYQIPARLFPPLGRLMLKYATKEAIKRLSDSGPVKILVDNTVLDVAITHETKWITTDVQLVQGYEHRSGHLARVPVHSTGNVSDRYIEATYLTSLAHVARLGHIALYTSAELQDEQFRQPMGRYRGYGLFDRSLFSGLRVPSLDGHVVPVMGPSWFDLPTASQQQRSRIRKSGDPLFEGIYTVLSEQLGSKCSQDCWHIRTAEVHACFAFLTTDRNLLRAWRSLRHKEPLRSLTTKVLSPVELAKHFDIHPVPPILMSFEGDALVRVDSTMPGEHRRSRRNYK